MSELTDTKEVQRRVFELTLALYRVTDFFPQGEVLKKNLREKANEVFGLIAEFGYSNNTEQDTVLIIGKVQSIRGYLELARSLRFVRPINITLLEREYDFLADFFEKELKVMHSPKEERTENTADINEKTGIMEKDAPKNGAISEELPTWEEFSLPIVEINKNISEDKFNGPTHIKSDLNARQKTILEHLRDAKQAKISHFYSVFSDISSKTIQRDLQDLVGKNMLRKEGEKRWTTYSLN